MPPPRSPYSVHPSFAREEAFEARLPESTGRTLAEWIALIRAEGPATEKGQREWLMRSHNLTTNYAWWLAERAAGRGGVDDYRPEELVEAMFAGGKAGLRPIYDALLRLGLGLADDVKACPCKTIVPLYRNHVFAQLKPTTRTRIDLGLALAKAKGKLPERLIDTGGLAKKDRITHRFALTSLADIDDEVKKWLRTAYDLDA